MTISPLSLEELGVLLEDGWRVFGSRDGLAWFEAPPSTSSLLLLTSQGQPLEDGYLLENEDGGITILFPPDDEPQLILCPSK